MKTISLRFAVRVVYALAFFLAASQAWGSTVYVQTNLVSDIPGLAQSTDPNLKNPWGVSFSATSPFWVSDAATTDSTLYQGTGSTVNSKVVSVPARPTGTVDNSTTGFIEADGSAASFIFSTLGGSIYAWNSANGNVAQQAAAVANASFTGLALANNGSGNFLYAANIAGAGGIDVFNSSFALVTLSGSFTDPNVPAFNSIFGSGYVPYNIQNINGQLFVEYSNFKLGLGAVSIFDANGNFIQELIPPGGTQLNEPWGIAMAPASFGAFGGDLLVGNFGNGQINAFSPTTGAFLGTVSGINGPIVIPGLWSLSVRTGGTFNTSAVYFTAGINAEADGLFGELTAATASTVLITTPSPLPSGKIGTAYTQTLAAIGGAPPYSNWSVTTGSLPAGVSMNSTTGILSGTPLDVSGTFSFTITVSDSSGAMGSSSYQLTIQQPPISTGLNRIGSFAEVASGGGWSTTITLINASAVTINAQVNFYADNGSGVTLPVTFPQFGTSLSTQSVNLTLSPNDSIVIQSAAATSSIAGGWADVQATGALSGYSIFGLSSAGSSSSQGTVSLDTRLLSSVLLPYNNTNGNQTALALANQTASAQTITATLLDQNGVQLASSTISLPAFGHSSFFLSSQFPQSANQLGTIQFQGSGGVTGIGLLFSSTGLFTSLPIIR